MSTPTTATGSITFNYALLPQIALSGIDYQYIQGTATINPGMTGTMIAVTTLEDVLYE